MSRFSRRSFLAASAACVAAPALGAVRSAAEVDVAIIGAGAAGIAAARRVAAAKRSFVIVEASNRVGGRCVTDTRLFGVPFDLGAHWIHSPARNPLAALAPAAGFEIYPAPRAQSMRIGPRPARDTELENFFAALVRAHRAIADAGRGKTDMPALRALPRDPGDWRPVIEFILGPYTAGKDLGNVSAVDLARLAEHETASFCRQGYGALLAKLAADLPVWLATPARTIAWRRNPTVETTRGTLRAGVVIVTVSTNVLVSNKIEFVPPLPARHRDAAATLSLGSFDHIALEMPGNPLDLQHDDLVFEQTGGSRTAALLANVSGTALHLIEVGGSFGRELAANGEAAMIDFARDWLTSSFGFNARRLIQRSHATRWNDEPWVLGAMSAAAPGGADARRILMESLESNVYFAGEAVHETQWGTVAGAWESGTRAAEAALRSIGALRREERPARHIQRRRH